MTLLPLESCAKHASPSLDSATVELHLNSFASDRALFVHADRVRAERLAKLGAGWNCWFSYDGERRVMILEFEPVAKR